MQVNNSKELHVIDNNDKKALSDIKIFPSHLIVELMSLFNHLFYKFTS